MLNKYGYIKRVVCLGLILVCGSEQESCVPNLAAPEFNMSKNTIRVNTSKMRLVAALLSTDEAFSDFAKKRFGQTGVESLLEFASTSAVRMAAPSDTKILNAIKQLRVERFTEIRWDPINLEEIASEAGITLETVNRRRKLSNAIKIAVDETMRLTMDDFKIMKAIKELKNEGAHIYPGVIAQTAGISEWTIGWRQSENGEIKKAVEEATNTNSRILKAIEELKAEDTHVSTETIAHRAGISMWFITSQLEINTETRLAVEEATSLTLQDFLILKAINELRDEGVSHITAAVIAAKAGFEETIVSRRSSMSDEVKQARAEVKNPISKILRAIKSLKEKKAHVTLQSIANEANFSKTTVVNWMNKNDRVRKAVEAAVLLTSDFEILRAIKELQSEGVYITRKNVANKAKIGLATLKNRSKINENIREALEAVVLEESDSKILKAIDDLKAEGVHISHEAIAIKAGLTRPTIDNRKKAERRVRVAVEEATSLAASDFKILKAIEDLSVTRKQSVRITYAIIADKAGVVPLTVSNRIRANPKVRAAVDLAIANSGARLATSLDWDDVELIVDQRPMYNNAFIPIPVAHAVSLQKKLTPKQRVDRITRSLNPQQLAQDFLRGINTNILGDKKLSLKLALTPYHTNGIDIVELNEQLSKLVAEATQRRVDLELIEVDSLEAASQITSPESTNQHLYRIATIASIDEINQVQDKAILNQLEQKGLLGTKGQIDIVLAALAEVKTQMVYGNTGLTRRLARESLLLLQLHGEHIDPEALGQIQNYTGDITIIRNNLARIAVRLDLGQQVLGVLATRMSA